LSAGNFYSAAVTGTHVIFSILLTLITLSALYHGLQQFQMTSERQVSLRNQTFFCLLCPIVIIYYTMLTLKDYIRAICTKKYYEEQMVTYYNQPSSSYTRYSSESSSFFENIKHQINP